MKYKLLRFSLIGIFAMLWGMTFAQDETITFSELGLENGLAIAANETIKGTDVQIQVSKGSGSTAPAYYTTGAALRLYGGNTMTVTSNTKTIVKVVFTFNGSNNLNDPTVSPGSYDSSTSTWTGDASQITFTRGGTSGHARIQKMEFYFSSENGQGGDPQDPGTNEDPEELANPYTYTFESKVFDAKSQTKTLSLADWELNVTCEDADGYFGYNGDK